MTVATRAPAEPDEMAASRAARRRGCRCRRSSRARRPAAGRRRPPGCPACRSSLRQRVVAVERVHDHAVDVAGHAGTAPGRALRSASWGRNRTSFWRRAVRAALTPRRTWAKNGSPKTRVAGSGDDDADRVAAPRDEASGRRRSGRTRGARWRARPARFASELTRGLPLTTRDTVACETPAARATSSMVTPRSFPPCLIDIGRNRLLA